MEHPLLATALDEGLLSNLSVFRPMYRRIPEANGSRKRTLNLAQKQQRMVKNRWKRCVTLCVKSPL
jgi:hypothetical protein